MKGGRKTQISRITHMRLKSYAASEELCKLFSEIEQRRTSDDLFHMAIHSNYKEMALLEIQRCGIERDFEIYKHIQNHKFQITRNRLMKTRREKPILFKTDMIRSILEGRKTQTRRLKGLDVINIDPDNYIYASEHDWKTNQWGFQPVDGAIHKVKSPYKKGDILYVRETYGIEKGKYKRRIYKAGDIAGNVMPVEKWITSIFMPKIAARIWLRVINIWPERLQDILKTDAIAEGIRHQNHNGDYYYFYPCHDLRDDTYIDNPITSFYSLWRLINGQKSWEENPWVWRIEFEVMSTNGKPTTDN